MFSRLEGQKITQTLELLKARIQERFPDHNLGSVAAELSDLSRHATQRMRHIRKPHPLRIVSFVLTGLTIALVAAVFIDLDTTIHLENVQTFVTFLEPALGCVVFLGAFLIFLWTLELRLKRRRILAAVHELRSIVHIVDMHQLTKDPERLLSRHSTTPSSPKIEFTPFLLGRYLDYCSEMLSLISKVSALYVQDLDDPVVLNAVDQIEALTTGLSRKIWQKIMILDRFFGAERRAEGSSSLMELEDQLDTAT